MSLPLQNYVRTFRRRHGLTQLQLAWLLGKKGHNHVSRIENRKRVPNLETALALEIVLDVPVRTLFRGLAASVERDVVRRRGISDDEERNEKSRA